MKVLEATHEHITGRLKMENNNLTKLYLTQLSTSSHVR